MDEQSVVWVELVVETSLVPDQDADVEARMAARYGTDRSRWPTLLIATIAAVAFLATALWAVLQLVDEPFEATVLRWQADGQRVVTMDLEVRGAAARNVRCAVRVKDGAASDVGYAYVMFSETPAARSFRIPTVVKAASVEVLACASEGQELVTVPADYPPGVTPPPTSPLP
jgi:hypothetical protein